VYVRRVNIAGNQKTQDEVIRRELRQLEASWYSLEKIARSKERLQRTSYFSE
jgi:outer membrane protein insertion porin family